MSYCHFRSFKKSSMENLNISVGIDIAKDKFDCCISYFDKSKHVKIVTEKIFTNNVSGFKSFLALLNSSHKQGCKMNIVMEATGVYHENLAHYLYANSQFDISILLPLKVKYYFKSLNVKSKTDKTDAAMISKYGLERRSNIWKPTSPNIRSIKQLSRLYRDLKKMLNQLKNRIHAKEYAYNTEVLVINILKQQIKLIENQCLQLEVELKTLVFEDSHLSKKMDILCTIPGVGFMTAITVVSETNGFELIKNAKQLCSYSGLDIKHNESGNMTGRSRLSKRGNKYIRQAMYMPALSASRHILAMKNFYSRINEKNKCKKVGLLAVSRKLLVLIFVLWKNEEVFDVNYMRKQAC